MASGTAEGTSIAAKLPPEVELREIGLSFTLPMGKNLSRTWSRELKTELESRIRLRVSKERFELGCSPPILIDAQWPAMNIELGGATVRFSDAHIDVVLSSVSGVTEGLIDFSDDARKEIRALLEAGLAGTAMGAPGYDPMGDAAVLATLEAIAGNFQKQPSSGTSDVSIADLGSPTAEVSIALKIPFVHESDGAGLSLPEGSVLVVSVSGSGKVAKIFAAGSTAEGIRAAKLESIRISSDSLSIVHGGKPVASLDRVRIDRGGAVALERMRLFGSLEEAASIESLLRVVASATGLADAGVPLEQGIPVAATSPDAEAQIVPGLVRGKIEAALAEGVRKLVSEYRSAIPGLDLEEILLGGGA
jgi:hypothetical protein